MQSVSSEVLDPNGRRWQRIQTGFGTPSIRRFHFEIPAELALEDAEWITWRRVSIPQRFAARISDARYPVRIEITIENGRALCVGLARIEEPFAVVDGSRRRSRKESQGPPITAEFLREIPLKRLVGQIAAKAVYHFGRAVPAAEEALRRDAALFKRLAEIHELEGRKQEARNRLPLAEVAKLYDEAAAAGSRSPTRTTWQALQRKGGGPAYSTVARWISLARDDGLLPATEKGRARAWRDVGSERTGRQ
jgi:hypothetical protein